MARDDTSLGQMGKRALAFARPWLSRAGDLLDWQRYYAERYILLPSANHLPLQVSLFMADALGWLDVVVPSFTALFVRREIEITTGAKGWKLLRLSAERKANPRRDFVYLARLSSGRDHFYDWHMTEIGRTPDDIALQERFWIVAGGHFPISAQIAMLQGQPKDRDLLIVAAQEVPGTTPAALRHRMRAHLQISASRRATDDLNKINTGQTTISDGGLLYLLTLLNTLQKSGGTFSLLIDVAGESKLSYQRPFAGFKHRPFAVGAPYITRLSKGHVVPYVATFGRKPRTVVVEWGVAFNIDEEASATASLDRLLDWLELGIARHPTQYLFPIGVERAWDSSTETWQDVPEPTPEPTVPAPPVPTLS